MDENMIRRIITAEVVEGDAEKRTLIFTGSDETQDRMDEIIRADGWLLKNYKKNPVFQWAHDYKLPPIGRSKRTWIDREEKKLKFEIEFAGPEIEYPAIMPSAETVYQLYKGGFLRAVSVGFIPFESEEGEGHEEEYGKPSKKPRRIFTKQDLLELSAVPVPANPNALQNAEVAGILSKAERSAVEEWVRKSDIESPEPRELITKPEEDDKRIRIPVRECDITATIDISKEQGISALYCGKVKKVATYIFLKSKGWTMATAKEWVKEHDGKTIAALETLDPKDIISEAEKYNCECIECGFKLKTEKHCDEIKCPKCGGKMRRAERPGPGKGLEEKPISQEALADELDYVCDLIEEVGLNETARDTAWNTVREIMRLSGDDIPVDIIDKIGAVLNKKNRERLTDIQRLAQEVIDSAGQPDKEEEPETTPTLEETWTAEDTEAATQRAILRVQGKLN